MSDDPLYAQVNGIRIAYERRGGGYGLMLLHGFPRTRRLWSRVTPTLASRFTVVAMDRRGYGDSERPTDEAAYDNRNMAQDTLELARHLGWDRFLLVGHDLSVSVARRLAMDHPEALSGVMLLDAASPGIGNTRPKDPTGRGWYLDFFRQRGVAESIINQNPRLFFSLFLDRNPHLTPEEHEFYVEVFNRPGAAEAVLADYRTGAEVDGPVWEEDVRAGRRIHTPLYILWSGRSNQTEAAVLEAWRQVADDVRGAAVPNSAHYIQEEQPEEVVRHIMRFADEFRLP